MSHGWTNDISKEATFKFKRGHWGVKWGQYPAFGDLIGYVLKEMDAALREE
jgi:hypothetical protein